jgi:hypothetical protein
MMAAATIFPSACGLTACGAAGRRIRQPFQFIGLRHPQAFQPLGRMCGLQGVFRMLGYGVGRAEVRRFDTCLAFLLKHLAIRRTQQELPNGIGKNRKDALR